MMSHWVWTLRQVSRRIWVRASLFSAPSSTRPRPIALAERPSLDDQEARISGCFTIGGVRSFDQGPRFWTVVLTEIASRAMSVCINDPGTAIDIIGRAVRLVAIWNEPSAPDREAACPAFDCRRHCARFRVLAGMAMPKMPYGIRARPGAGRGRADN